MIPRILVIDDEAGRTLPGRRNSDRENACRLLGLRDVTGDETAADPESISNPVAECVFIRGQRPPAAKEGDEIANSLDDCLAAIASGWPAGIRQPWWSLLLLDLQFMTGTAGLGGKAAKNRTWFGLDIARECHQRWPGIPIVALSATEREETAEARGRADVLKFIEKGSESPDNFRRIMQEHALLEDDAEGPYRIVGRSPDVLMALRAARRASRRLQDGTPPAPVILIQGETGTGKEMFARYIWQNTPTTGRTVRPYLIINAGAIKEELWQSEVFGHLKGSFTGASGDRAGAIELADGGDLFLDEVADTPKTIQEGLLRVVEDNVVTRMGDKTDRRVNVRYIFASNRNLENLVEAGLFREDLYYRMAGGARIDLPPLRERLGDIRPLADWLVSQQANRDVPITEAAYELLENHDWPGNIRELRNLIKTALESGTVEILTETQVLRAMRPKSSSSPGTRAASGAPAQPAREGSDVPAEPQGSRAEPSAPVEDAEGLVAGRDHKLGALARAEEAAHRTYGRILSGAADAVARQDPDTGKTVRQWTRVVAHALGHRVKTQTAASWIWKVFNLKDQRIVEELTSDPVLLEAYAWALTVRKENLLLVPAVMLERVFEVSPELREEHRHALQKRDVKRREAEAKKAKGGHTARRTGGHGRDATPDPRGLGDAEVASEN